MTYSDLTFYETEVIEVVDKVIYSVLLSYHLPNSMRERCKSFMNDYPELDYVEVDWSSYKEPGKILRARIKPEMRGDEIEFNFVRMR